MKETSSRKTAKTCLITGATSSMGTSISLTFAKNGYHLILTGRNEKKLRQVKSLIKAKSGDSPTIIAANLTNYSNVQQIITTVKENGTIDTIVHCAGVWHSKETAYYGIDFEDYDQDVIDDTLEVTLNSFMTITHGLIPLMKQNQGGSIIAITGTFENGAAGWLPYYTSKQALEAYCKGLSDELADAGIRVNCISPSDTNTTAYRKFFPDEAQNSLNPQEISNFALFLASEKAKYITGSSTVMKKY